MSIYCDIPVEIILQKDSNQNSQCQRQKKRPSDAINAERPSIQRVK